MAFASLGFGAVHYRDIGPRDAPAIVFVNSLGTDMSIWGGVVERLAADYRIVTFDARGHGLSSVPGGPYTLEGLAGDLLELVDRLQLGTFAVVGVSVGGMVALRLAIDHPQRLRAVVACDTAAKIGDADTWNGRIDTAQTSGMTALADPVLLRWFPESIREGRADEIARWRDLLLRTPVEGYVATCAALRDADLTAEVSSIAVPTLIVVGAVDQSTPVALVRDTAARIPGARFEIIEHAGHIPSIDQPARLAALIAEHLEAVRG